MREQVSVVEAKERRTPRNGTMTLLSPQDRAVYAQLQEIWHRELGQLSTAKDFPRFAKNLRIHKGAQEELIWDAAISEVSEGSAHAGREYTHSALLCMARQLEGPEGEAAMRDRLARHLASNQGQDLGQSLAALFAELPRNQRLYGVLKAVHQEMPFPIIRMMRTDVYQALPYKDVRGSWHITVLVKPDSVDVIHSKLEQSYSSDPAESFQFGWTLRLSFNAEVDSMTPSWGVTSFQVPPGSTVESNSLAASLRHCMHPTCYYNNISARGLVPEECLKLLYKFSESLRVRADNVDLVKARDKGIGRRTLILK